MVIFWGCGYCWMVYSPTFLCFYMNQISQTAAHYKDHVSGFTFYRYYLCIKGNHVIRNIVVITSLSCFSVQTVLPLIPKLKHVIYVDQKKMTTEGYPAGLSIHSMQAVRELGALPENSVYFSVSFWLSVIFDFFFLFFFKSHT